MVLCRAKGSNLECKSNKRSRKRLLSHYRLLLIYHSKSFTGRGRRVTLHMRSHRPKPQSFEIGARILSETEAGTEGGEKEATTSRNGTLRSRLVMCLLTNGNLKSRLLLSMSQIHTLRCIKNLLIYQNEKSKSLFHLLRGSRTTHQCPLPLNLLPRRRSRLKTENRRPTRSLNLF